MRYTIDLDEDDRERLAQLRDIFNEKSDSKVIRKVIKMITQRIQNLDLEKEANQNT